MMNSYYIKLSPSNCNTSAQYKRCLYNEWYEIVSVKHIVDTPTQQMVLFDTLLKATTSCYSRSLA